MDLYIETPEGLRLASVTQLLQGIATRTKWPCKFKLLTDEQIEDFINLPCWPEREEMVLALFLNARGFLTAQYFLHAGPLDADDICADEVFKATRHYWPARVLLVHRYPSAKPSLNRVDRLLQRQLQKVFAPRSIEVVYKVFGLKQRGAPKLDMDLKVLRPFFFGKPPVYYPATRAQVLMFARAASAKSFHRGVGLDEEEERLKWAQIYAAPITVPNVSAMFLDRQSFLLHYEKIPCSLEQLPGYASMLYRIARRCKASIVVLIDSGPDALERAKSPDLELFKAVNDQLLLPLITQLIYVAADATDAQMVLSASSPLAALPTRMLYRELRP